MTGLHQPVMLNEVIDGLHIRPQGTYVDCTFGRGGHSQAILQQLNGQGRLIALDRDPQAIESAQSLIDTYPNFCIVHASFSELADVMRKLEIQSVDGILLDLGVSSPQIDNGERGFSFRFNGPLDMRMDTTRGTPVSDWLNHAEITDITEVIRDYGEERFAWKIANAIAQFRSHTPITTTQELADIVRSVVRRNPREPRGPDPATRTFQALRIYWNDELGELSTVLTQCLSLLAKQGRLAIISFHSLEDRIVKQFLQKNSKPEILPRKLPIRYAEQNHPDLRLIKNLQRPSEIEAQQNPRARSARLRVAERISERTADESLI